MALCYAILIYIVSDTSYQLKLLQLMTSYTRDLVICFFVSELYHMCKTHISVSLLEGPTSAGDLYLYVTFPVHGIQG